MIKAKLNSMYQGTQNTILDNIIVDHDRDEKKLRAIQRELYVRHACEQHNAMLSECMKTKDYCLDEAAVFENCLQANSVMK